MKVVLAGSRACCAGVDRAIATVTHALRLYGAPVYVRGQIVHNAHVVAELRERGAVFVTDLDEVPDEGLVIFSAHGVSPAVRARARERRLRTIDATCPLVAKVHAEARRLAATGTRIVLIGHADHDEVQGTLGEAPEAIQLAATPEDADHLDVPPEAPVAYLTQTTLAMADVAPVVDRLRHKYPRLTSPPTSDICYATTNRQTAVQQIAAQADLVLVVGSANSSNSVRLVEVAQAAGCPAHLVEDAGGIDPAWLEGVGTVGVTAGASTPESLVQQVIAALAPAEIVHGEPITEDIVFRLPPGITGPQTP
ncbi:4-hydroxy-3-methylbut-2-enyl diphosphate reductase [Amycolatopsis sp. NPDC059021]|uniref:4-hydroxy-3-methylbut-2-enyl diphosphate reductase n=1 Tax=Amycolatopsis sp. NPDC059021 TaxID=3346704 RepID=UPI00366EFD10